jgi:poly-gamma-glutamate synthesis protein (capsule biosynthesis protein)
MADNVTLLAGGDVGPNIDPVDALTELILPVLKQADLRFGQCERIYTDKKYSNRHGHCPTRQASLWKTAGIDIVGMANNAATTGPEPCLDTIEYFRNMGMEVIGVGKDIEEARKPAIVVRNGIRIAFLGYCSVFKDGEQATRDRAGVTPMRAHTYYQRGGDPGEEYQPGTPPRILTSPHEEDLRALQDDIRKAKQQADVVVMSIHWGVHMIPKTIATYQPIVAHAAIDAGADLILGHHPHTLKGIEVYKGKVCFYSLGNFMITSPNKLRDPKVWNRWGGLWWYRLDPKSEYLAPGSKYLYTPDGRITMLAKVVFSKQGVERVSFLPAIINPQAQPAVVLPEDPRFQDILDYVNWLSDEFPPRLTADGGEIVVGTD